MRNIFYYAALEEEDIVGLSIATRADCLPDEVLALLKELDLKTDLTVELGMQSIKDKTIDFINRGYDHKSFDRGMDRLSRMGIDVIAHVIVGLPGEDMYDYLDDISYINRKNFWAIKIHNLYVENDSDLKDYYEKNNISYTMTKEDYANIVISMLRQLNPGTVIARLTGDGIRDRIAYPAWSKNKGAVLSTIDKIMKERDYRQGDLWTED